MQMKLDESQQRSFENIVSLEHTLCLLTGGPGFGKSYLVKTILKEIFADNNNNITPFNTYLCTPTGKSSKVLNDALQEDFEFYPLIINPPTTIHRMLGCKGPGPWEYNETCRLEAGLIVMDETSMVDSVLMARVFRSVSVGCRFIIVGDKDQLQSVGPGAVFGDIIRMNIPGTINRLEVNHRAAEGGMIAHASDLIKIGQPPIYGKKGNHTLGGKREDDLFLHLEDEKDNIPELVFSLCKKWYKNGDDFQILSPQKTGVCGVENLNLELQKRLNPPSNTKNEYEIFPWLTLREGDKVINTKNNYKLDIFNGFTGIIESVKLANNKGKNHKIITVDFDGEIVEIKEPADIKNLQLAYVITIHKSQGSEYKKGILICHSAHYFMLSRSLMYVGLSRFKDELHIIGDNKGLSRAIKNNTENKRNTYLSKFAKIKGENP